jgi:hypothetical protein
MGSIIADKQVELKAFNKEFGKTVIGEVTAG